MKKVSINKAMLLASIILMDILGGAEVDLFVPSFPELQSQFSLSLFLVEGLLSINFLGFCVSLVFVGWLADVYGHKRVIVAGLIVFVIGSLFCVFTEDSINFILVGRFFQGVGVAAPATLCFLIIADLYSLKQQQYLMAMLNGLVNLSVATIGSYITMYFHWKGNFMVLLCLGLITLLMTTIFVPRRQRVAQEEFYSPDGKKIFRSKLLLLMILNIIFTFVPYWIFVGISPVLYMNDLGVDLSHFGIYQGAWALLFALGCVLSGPIIKRFNQRKLLYISGQLCIINLAITAVLIYLDSMSPLHIAIVFALYGISTIIPIMIIYPICINFMPKLKGRVSVIIQGGCLILTAIGLHVVSYSYQGSFQSIGVIMSIVILSSIVTLFFIIRSDRIMEFSVE